MNDQDKRKMDQLIDGLSDDLKPCKCMGHPLCRLLPLLAISILLTIAAVLIMGLRSDIGAKLAEPDFLLEIGAMALIALTSLASASWLAVPDMRGHKWLPYAPIALTVLFSAWTLVEVLTLGAQAPALEFHHCMMNGVVMGAIPALAMFFLTKKGATTHPFLMGASGALAITSLAYIGLRLSCHNDAPDHVALTHVSPYVLIGICVGFIARRLYRW